MNPFDPRSLLIALDAVREAGLDREAEWFEAKVHDHKRDEYAINLRLAHRQATVARIARYFGYSVVMYPDGKFIIGHALPPNGSELWRPVAPQVFGEILSWLDDESRLLRGLEILITMRDYYSGQSGYFLIHMRLEIGGQIFSHRQEVPDPFEIKRTFQDCYQRFIHRIGSQIEMV